jgi:hypothetical protein
MSMTVQRKVVVIVRRAKVSAPTSLLDSAPPSYPNPNPKPNPNPNTSANTGPSTNPNPSLNPNSTPSSNTCPNQNLIANTCPNPQPKPSSNVQDVKQAWHEVLARARAAERVEREQIQRERARKHAHEQKRAFARECARDPILAAREAMLDRAHAFAWTSSDTYAERMPRARFFQYSLDRCAELLARATQLRRQDAACKQAAHRSLVAGVRAIAASASAPRIYARASSTGLPRVRIMRAHHTWNESAQEWEPRAALPPFDANGRHSVTSHLPVMRRYLAEWRVCLPKDNAQALLSRLRKLLPAWSEDVSLQLTVAPQADAKSKTPMTQTQDKSVNAHEHDQDEEWSVLRADAADEHARLLRLARTFGLVDNAEELEAGLRGRLARIDVARTYAHLDVSRTTFHTRRPLFSLDRFISLPSKTTSTTAKTCLTIRCTLRARAFERARRRLLAHVADAAMNAHEEPSESESEDESKEEAATVSRDDAERDFELRCAAAAVSAQWRALGEVRCEDSSVCLGCTESGRLFCTDSGASRDAWAERAAVVLPISDTRERENKSESTSESDREQARKEEQESERERLRRADWMDPDQHVRFAADVPTIQTTWVETTSDLPSIPPARSLECDWDWDWSDPHWFQFVGTPGAGSVAPRFGLDLQ